MSNVLGLILGRVCRGRLEAVDACGERGKHWRTEIEAGKCVAKIKDLEDYQLDIPHSSERLPTPAAV